jgi:hypothetical protein
VCPITHSARSGHQRLSWGDSTSERLEVGHAIN